MAKSGSVNTSLVQATSPFRLSKAIPDALTFRISKSLSITGEDANSNSGYITCKSLLRFLLHFCLPFLLNV